MKLVDLTVSRVIDASAFAVFDAWTDPAQLGAWFGTARVIATPVVDGLYYLGVEHAGRIWPHYGRYLRIERPRLVEQTWVSESTGGRESIVALAIEPRGDRVELTIRHTGVPDDDEGRKHEAGWRGLLEAMDQRLGR